MRKSKEIFNSITVILLLFPLAVFGQGLVKNQKRIGLKRLQMVFGWELGLGQFLHKAMLWC